MKLSVGLMNCRFMLLLYLSQKNKIDVCLMHPPFCKLVKFYLQDFLSFNVPHSMTTFKTM